MPYDSNGNYSLPSQYFVQLGDDVLPSQHNPPFEDVRNALSSVLVKDGRAPMTGPLNMGGYTVGNLSDGVDPQDAATVAQAAYAIGDFKDSARDLGSKWLRRNGALYAKALYPDLADVLPSLPDGVDWTSRVSGTTSTIRHVIHDGTRFIGVGGTSIITSPNGEDWVLLQTITGADLYGVAYGNGIYLIVDVAAGKTYTSADGETWSDRGVKNASGIFGVCFSSANSKFVMAGGGGYIGTTEDGVNYTTESSGTTNGFWKIREVNSTVIAVGNSGTMATSTNASVWTLRTTGTTQRLLDVSYYGGTYVAVGINGVIITSTNLSTWVSRTSGTTSLLNVSLASSSGFMVAGSEGVVRISADGTTWTASATGVSGAWQSGIVYPTNPARYLLAGPSQTIADGLRTLPTQFRTPNDKPDYGWIRALA